MPHTVETRSLLNERLRKVLIDPSLMEIFNEWKKVFTERMEREPTEIDLFYAGYMLSNPSVKDLFRKTKLKN